MPLHESFVMSDRKGNNPRIDAIPGSLTWKEMAS